MTVDQGTFSRDKAIQEIRNNNILSHDIINYFLGDLIGWGVSRAVFEDNHNPKRVYKIDFSSINANVLEFDVWSDVQYVEAINKWFAPIYNMSRCGRILSQARCKEIPIDKLPARIPRFFTDIKRSNFGLFNGNVVCLDYAGNLLKEQGMSLKFRKANWKVCNELV